MILMFLVLIVVSMVIIWRACDGFETASEYLGRNLSDGVRGGTINAIGSSLPELLTAMIGLLFLSDTEGFSFGIGATAGSAVFNSAVIPGLVILMVTLTSTNTIKVSKKVILRDGIALLLAELLLIVILSKDALTWADAVIMLMFYMMYLVIMLNTMESPQYKEEEEEDALTVGQSSIFWSIVTLDLSSIVIRDGRKITTPLAWTLITISMIVIGIACFLLVEACVGLSGELNVASYFVAVILAAAATSVPDTILSIKDAKKGEYDDAVANALGSNIFDICVALGLPLLLYTLIFNAKIHVIDNANGSVTELRLLLLIITFVIFLLLLLAKRVTKIVGLSMLLLYVAFVAFVVAKAYSVPIALNISHKLHAILVYMDNILG